MPYLYILCFDVVCRSGVKQVDIPYRQFQHEGRDDTVLSMNPITINGNEFVLLNDAADNTYLINPESAQTHRVGFSTKQQFPHTFQRREQFHFIRIHSRNFGNVSIDAARMGNVGQRDFFGGRIRDNTRGHLCLWPAAGGDNSLCRLVG